MDRLLSPVRLDHAGITERRDRLRSPNGGSEPNLLVGHFDCGSISETHHKVNLPSDRPSKGPHVCCEFIELQLHVTVLQTPVLVTGSWVWSDSTWSGTKRGLVRLTHGQCDASLLLSSQSSASSFSGSETTPTTAEQSHLCAQMMSTSRGVLFGLPSPLPLPTRTLPKNKSSRQRSNAGSTDSPFSHSFRVSSQAAASSCSTTPAAIQYSAHLKQAMEPWSGGAPGWTASEGPRKLHRSFAVSAPVEQ